MSHADQCAERPVVIFGAGSLALQTWCRLRESGREVCAFVVDDALLSGASKLRELPIIAFSRLSDDYPPDRCEMFVAVGYRRMRSRREVYERVRAAGYRCVNAVSPRAFIDDQVQLGENNLIFPGCIVESGVSIGSNNVMWSGVTLCHDSRIGDHNFMAPRTVIAGNCVVQDLCFFGVASVCIDGLNVCSETYLKAGAVLFSSSVEFGMYGGNPAEKFGSSNPSDGIRIERSGSALAR